MTEETTEVVPAQSELSFPRLRARTARFTLGEPRSFAVAPDGSRVTFLRSDGPYDRANALWVFDLETGVERLVADPARLLDGDEELSVEERARRERAREQAAGIVGFANDREHRVASFSLSGRVWLADLLGGGAHSLPTVGNAVDPQVDPTGRLVAYASGGSLRVIGVDGTDDRTLTPAEGDTVVWGLAEFIAAEEMDRTRGFWWAPNGESLLVERYDESPVAVWHIADPAHPERQPIAQRYPAAGTANADVSLWHIQLDGSRQEVQWDHAAFPYLAVVTWSRHGVPLLQVQSRDQRQSQVLAVSMLDATTQLVSEQSDDAWVELVPGTPSRLPSGAIVTTVEDDDTRRVAVNGVPVSPVGLQVRSVLGVDDDGILLAVSTEPSEIDVVRVSPAYHGSASYTSGASLTPVSTTPGVHTARSSGGTTVLVSRSLDTHGATVRLLRDGNEVGRLASYAADPGFLPSVSILRAGELQIRYALVLPRDHIAGSAQLPVLMAPYGGPHGQRVTASSAAFLEPQWLADQGFAVVLADGRGTPGRGTSWERAIAGDVATPVLDDQVTALEAAAVECPDLDLSRVAMRGWSFGGYLSALAVLRRPDVFHAAIAGAPVTDWRLYDTHYTERYLGHPDEHPETYQHCSLIADAPELTRPLLFIHGLADDNVVAAHTLRMSQALLEAGRPHRVLPLSGVTHMTPQEVVAENLLLLEVDFLREALGLAGQ